MVLPATQIVRVLVVLSVGALAQCRPCLSFLGRKRILVRGKANHSDVLFELADLNVTENAANLQLINATLEAKEAELTVKLRRARRDALDPQHNRAKRAGVCTARDGMSDEMG